MGLLRCALRYAYQTCGGLCCALLARRRFGAVVAFRGRHLRMHGCNNSTNRCTTTPLAGACCVNDTAHAGDSINAALAVSHFGRVRLTD